MIAKFDLNDTVKSWILDKVEAKQYKLLELSAQGSIDNKQLKIEKEPSKQKAIFTGGRIHFKENVAPVLAPRFVLRTKMMGCFLT